MNFIKTCIFIKMLNGQLNYFKIDKLPFLSVLLENVLLFLGIRKVKPNDVNTNSFLLIFSSLRSSAFDKSITPNKYILLFVAKSPEAVTRTSWLVKYFDGY